MSSSLTASAASHCVRAGATGAATGNNWTDAYTSLPSSLIRGDTYYIADGSYPGYTLDDAVNGSLLITIKKATATDHYTDVGWNSTYGDGQAVFSDAINVSTSNYLIDGQTGGGAGQWDNLPRYGFAVWRYAGGSNTKNCTLAGGVTNLTMRHIDFAFPDNFPGFSPNPGQDNIYIRYNCKGITFSYCAFRYPSRCHVLLYYNVTNVVVEHCWHLYNRAYDGVDSNHAQSWQACEADNDITIRHNLFEDCSGTGILAVMDLGAGAESSQRWEIYGNVFWHTGNRDRYTASDSPIVVINSQNADYWKIYNNTFISMRPMDAGGNMGIDFSQGGMQYGGHHQVYNNVWYDALGYTEAVNIEFMPGDTTSVHDYNYFNNISSIPTEAHRQIGTGNPFVDFTHRNFSLAAPTDPGFALSAPYNVDMSGVRRGADGTWDRGACEFNSTNQVTRPKAPANLKLVAIP